MSKKSKLDSEFEGKSLARVTRYDSEYQKKEVITNVGSWPVHTDEDYLKFAYHIGFNTKKHAFSIIMTKEELIEALYDLINLENKHKGKFDISTLDSDEEEENLWASFHSANECDCDDEED